MVYVYGDVGVKGGMGVRVSRCEGWTGCRGV